MRQALVIALAGTIIIGGAVAFVLMRPSAEPPKAAVRPEPSPLPPPVLRGRSGSETTAARPDGNPASARKPETRDMNSPAPAAPAAAAANLATLRFESDVPGATVFLDRVPLGEMPITASDVKPGPHRVNASAPGYELVVETIEVVPGPRDIVFAFKQVRLDAKIDVVHHHRIGSCSGRLIATPRGMRYETTDTNDAFTVPLLEVGALQIDYLANRLRITARGKRYEFSDPKGNADPLFVFHRDVEAARARLKKGDLPAPE